MINSTCRLINTRKIIFKKINIYYQFYYYYYYYYYFTRLKEVKNIELQNILSNKASILIIMDNLTYVQKLYK